MGRTGPAAACELEGSVDPERLRARPDRLDILPQVLDVVMASLLQRGDVLRLLISHHPFPDRAADRRQLCASGLLEGGEGGQRGRVVRPARPAGCVRRAQELKSAADTMRVPLPTSAMSSAYSW